MCVCAFLTRPEKEAEILAHSNHTTRMIIADSKMVLSTIGGRIILIDNFNLTTFQDDFKDYTLASQADQVCSGIL